MSVTLDISSELETSYLPLSQLVPQLTMPPTNTEISLQGMISINYIIVIKRKYFKVTFSPDFSLLHNRCGTAPY